MNIFQYTLAAVILWLITILLLLHANWRTPTFDERWEPIRHIELHDEIDRLLFKLAFEQQRIHNVAAGPECSWINECWID